MDVEQVKTVGCGSLSSLAENCDGFQWVSPEKSAPRVGCGGSVGMSGGGDYNGAADSSPGKRGSEIVGRCNKAAGSGGSGGQAAADNSLIGFELASSGGSGSGLSMSNNGNANTSKPPSASPSPSPSPSSSASYSKLFLQYLPYTLNLNTKRASNREHSSGQPDNCNKPTRGNKCELENQLVCGTNTSHQHNNKPRRGLVGALSRFKISSSAGHHNPNHQQQQKSHHNKQAAAEEEKEALFDFGERLSNKLDTKCGPSGAKTLHASRVRKPADDNCQLIQFNTQDTQRGASNGNSKPQVCHKELKRKGFLYLKRNKCNSNNLDAPSAANCNNNQAQGSNANTTTTTCAPLVFGIQEQQQHRQTVLHKASSGTRPKRRDSNNNSISHLLGASGHHHHQDEEHARCLLGDCDEEDEDAEQEVGKRASFVASSTSRSKPELEHPFEVNNNRGIMSAINTEESGSANNNNSMSNGNKYTTIKRSAASRATGSYGGGGGRDPTKAFIIASGLMLIGLCALLTGAGKSFGALALQQQQQQPFSRSQRGPGGSSLSAAPLPSQTSGGGPQSSVAGSGGPGGASRPAPQPAAGSLVASINCNKIRGHVTLTPNLQGGTTVTTQISAGPPGEVYQWSVHQFPVKPGAAMCSCSPMILGSKLIDLSEMHGNLPSDQEFNVQSSLSLFGSESPVGHSLLLRGMKTGMVACATFLPTSRKSNYRAKFHSPISGSVTIFQTAFGTSFISHLMYSNGTRRHSMHRFDLMKSEDDMVTTSLLGGIQVGGNSMTAGSSRAESLALEQREHEHELTQCRRYAQGEPLFRNMSYQLAVSTENFGMRGRTAMVLPQIPFETFASVFVLVYSELDPQEPMACAPLKFVKPKTAAAKFQSVSVQGSVLFSQDSPYDVTVARINLQLPNSDGHSYGIDELPMIIRRKSDTRVCPNIREIIYNPHHVEPSSVPPEGEATSDQYAVGDLSGKYGSLTGKASEKIQVNDFNLPLYGPVSIVGRAMTIYSAEGVAIACSNVELTTPMTTAFATFDYGIQGQFIFRQPVNDCNGDTYVYIEVSKPVVPGAAGATTTAAAAGAPGSQDRSVDHNWHIHVSPVDSGLDHLSTTDCAPAGPHFNPYNSSTGSIYSRDCSPFNVFRCELGDMSGKMFTIEIPPYRVKGAQEPDIGKFFGTDIDLPLCGPVSIVNRSVVVHGQDFGHQRLACSTVIEFKPRTS